MYKGTIKVNAEVPEDNYYTVREVMQILKRSKSAVLAYINAGLLKARKLRPDALNSKMIIKRSDLEDFINNGVPAGYYQKLYPRPHKEKQTGNK